EAHYSERLVRFKHLPLYYHRPPPPGDRLDRARFDLPADARVYGCLHSTFKLHPQFDEALAEILRADEKGVVLLPQAEAARWDEIVRERFAASFGDVIDQLRFIPRVRREEFRALNQMCDVTLAPFPFGAGDTSLEALALGVPVVTMPTPFLRGRFTHAMYRAMGMMDCVAENMGEYVKIALRLGQDRRWRDQVKKKILES